MNDRSFYLGECLGSLADVNCLHHRNLLLTFCGNVKFDIVVTVSFIFFGTLRLESKILSRLAMSIGIRTVSRDGE